MEEVEGLRLTKTRDQHMLKFVLFFDFLRSQATGRTMSRTGLKRVAKPSSTSSGGGPKSSAKGSAASAKKAVQKAAIADHKKSKRQAPPGKRTKGQGERDEERRLALDQKWAASSAAQPQQRAASNAQPKRTVSLSLQRDALVMLTSLILTGASIRRHSTQGLREASLMMIPHPDDHALAVVTYTFHP